MTCTDEDTPVFRRSAANPDVGISWLSDDSYCCPHFICTTCGKPIRHDAPGIVTWRYAKDEPYASTEYRIKHKTPDCDRRDTRREGGHFWFWDDLDDVLDQLIFNTLGRTPPPSPKLHRQFDSVPPELIEPQTKRAPKPRAAKPRRGSKRDLGAATSMAQRWRIMRRDEWTCQRCHRSADEHRVALHVDHMQPASKGGTADDSNLWTLCEDCNLGKSDELS